MSYKKLGPEGSTIQTTPEGATQLDHIQVTARFSIHSGKHDEFIELADECIRIVEEQDTGTLQYDWFFNDAGDECIVRETYSDSDAVLEHISHVGEQLGELLEISDLDLKVFGDPSAELVEASAGLSPHVYGFYNGSGQGG